MNYSKIIKDALALFIITIIAGVLLGFVYEITKEPIQVTKEKAKREAYQIVYNEAKNFEANDELVKQVKSSADILTQNGFANIVIDEALEAKDESGETLGLALTVTTKEGYGGDITITIGIANDQTVKGMEILSISETAGLGMKAKDDNFKSQYKDKKVNSFAVTKNGAASDNEIDAISGATITSNAVTGAMNAGISFSENYLTGGKQ